MAGTSSRIRKKALRDPTYGLKDILVDGRRDEQSAFQAREIESKDTKRDEINEVKRTQQCHFCGGSYPREKGPCPAKGKDCRKCGKQNHFAKVCRGKQQQQKQQRRERRPKKRNETPKPVNPLKSKDNDSDTSSEDYLYTVKNKKTPSVRVKVCKHLFDATINTGATINIIDQTTYSKMHGVNLKQTNIKAFAYTATEPVKFRGKFEAVIETRKRIAVATFYVAQTSNSGNLRSATTAHNLGLISLHVNKLTESKDAKID